MDRLIEWKERKEEASNRKDATGRGAWLLRSRSIEGEIDALCGSKGRATGLGAGAWL